MSIQTASEANGRCCGRCVGMLGFSSIAFDLPQGSPPRRMVEDES
jgi:hypothetical protein